MAKLFGGYSEKPTPVNNDEVAGLDSVTGLNVWYKISSLITSFFNPTNMPTDYKNGWIDAQESWTYSSYDSTNKTGVITVPSDATTKYQKGWRVRFTNSGTAKYGIITKITSTTLTIYFGTNYSLANAAITVPFYSNVKSPFGFPSEPDLWTVTTTSTSDRTGFGNGTWGSLTETVIAPIGSWTTRGKYLLQITNTQQANRRAFITLSSDAATETNTPLTVELGQTPASATSATIQSSLSVLPDTINVTTATTFTAMGMLSSSTNFSATLVGSQIATVLKLVCAYL